MLTLELVTYMCANQRVYTTWPFCSRYAVVLQGLHGCLGLPCLLVQKLIKSNVEEHTTIQYYFKLGLYCYTHRGKLCTYLFISQVQQAHKANRHWEILWHGLALPLRNILTQMLKGYRCTQATSILQSWKQHSGLPTTELVSRGVYGMVIRQHCLHLALPLKSQSRTKFSLSLSLHQFV